MPAATFLEYLLQKGRTTINLDKNFNIDLNGDRSSCVQILLKKEDEHKWHEIISIPYRPKKSNFVYMKLIVAENNLRNSIPKIQCLTTRRFNFALVQSG